MKQYELIVKKNRDILKKQLKQFISEEKYLIFLTRIFKSVSCKNPTSIEDRIYDFFEIYYPEMTLKLSKEKLSKLIYKSKTFERKRLSNQWVSSESIGLDLTSGQIEFIEKILVFFDPKLKWKLKHKLKLQEILTQEISQLLKNIIPKTSELVEDDILCALLIEKAKGIKTLATKSSNYIQLLGAETSFFNNYNPKFGLIYNHQSIKESKDKGKSARILANKISLKIREDYFK